MIWAALVMALSGPSDAPLTLSEAVKVSGSELRLSDLADLSVLPGALARRAETLVVARLDAPRQSVSARDVSARARAALPGLSPWLPDGPDHAILVESDEASARPSIKVETPRAAAAPAVRAGDAVTVRAAVGPVTVERPAEAIQDGWIGRSVFVRTADGVVLAVRLADGV